MKVMKHVCGGSMRWNVCMVHGMEVGAVHAWPRQAALHGRGVEPNERCCEAQVTVADGT